MSYAPLVHITSCAPRAEALRSRSPLERLAREWKLRELLKLPELLQLLKLLWRQSKLRLLKLPKLLWRWKVLRLLKLLKLLRLAPRASCKLVAN